jgi:DNA polymerase alpha subunit A
MGPCWIDIRGFTASTANLSHCKIEVNVQNPKNIKRGEDAPAPPVVTMTLKMKTVVNPKSHKSEIVSLCAVCNRDGDIEGGGVSSASSMQQLSLVRPLGLAASEGVMNTFPHDLDNEIRSVMPQLKKNPNERAMISRFMAQVGAWDPDVIVGHNAWGFDVEVLLSRCKELKVNTWDRLGRLKRSTFPGHGRFENGVKDWVIAECLTGRVLCDTYISSKELLRETTYSLTNLSATQLKVKRVEIEPQDIPVWFNASKNIVQLCQHTLMDCQLVGRLLDKLQVLPLTRQLTNISGNCWARTMKGNRAERTDYLLLHEFRKLKYICPDKQTYDNSDSSGGGKKREKAKYSGGLVLEPKKGLYDTFILLLDFNSLYPSIIQEYNLCHTTMNWSGHHAKMMQDKAASGVRSNINGEDDDDDDEVVEDVGNDLPPIPDESLDTGVLPRVIRTIIQRRGVVKKMLKEKNLGAEKKKELDIRQKALKLTANSMYGCLGFSFSR